jgi:DNA polymerase iota
MTDIVDYNVNLLNAHDLSNSFFCLSKDDPTLGFSFDASSPAGHIYGECSATNSQQLLCQRLILGSHLALHMRLQLEKQKGYTSSVGVSTSKLLSKLVGNGKIRRDMTMDFYNDTIIYSEQTTRADYTTTTLHI